MVCLGWLLEANIIMACFYNSYSKLSSSYETHFKEGKQYRYYRMWCRDVSVLWQLKNRITKTKMNNLTAEMIKNYVDSSHIRTEK